MDWLARLREYKKKSGKTYKVIAKETGIPQTTIEKLFSGRTEDPKLGTTKLIAQCLGCTLDELAGMRSAPVRLSLSEGEKRVLAHYRSLDETGRKAAEAFLRHEAKRCEALREAVGRAAGRREQPQRRAPVFTRLYYDFPVSAGTGEYLDDSTAVIVELECEPPRGTDYILRVAGDSMEPEYHDGDCIYVRRTDTLSYGEIGIFVSCGNVYMKEYTRSGLRSLNPKYALIPGSGDIRCLGKVLGRVEGGMERAE